MSNATTARRTRKQAGAPAAGQPAPEVDGQGETPEPSMTIDPEPITFYRPKVTMPDGTVIACAHRWPHEHEKAAAACGRKIARLGRFEK